MNTAGSSLRRAAAVLSFLLPLLAGHILAQAPAAPATPNAQAVWAREQLYWTLVKAGDVEHYVQLWDDNFRGWPCGDQHPATKASIGGWVKRVRDEKQKVIYALTFEGAADFGDVVIIYYQTPMTFALQDGRMENGGKVFKFTHTWHRVNGTWLIMGGMCGELLPRA